MTKNSALGVAAFIVALIAVPLGIVFAQAIIDAEVRTQEAPFRAVLGSERYEALIEGEGGFPHYLGQNLLAPDFELRDRSGRAWKLRDQRGKTLILNFWTITCKPCIEEMPSLETLAYLVAPWDDVEVVAISTDSSWDKLRSFINERSKITHLLDPTQKVVRDQFGTKYFPETWIVDKEGVVRFRYDGALDWSNPIVVDLIRAYR